ncbi:DUF362 domain-containing protein [Thermodesulfobacteriota bacterium]
MNNIVSIRKISTSIKAAIEQSLIDVGGIDHIIGTNDRVLLKPNVNGNECVTNIRLVEALIEILYDNSIKNIAIAESTFGSDKTTHNYFRQNGYFELSKKWDVEIINLNASEVVEIPVGAPLVKKNLRIAKEVFEADKLINLPVMKVHYATGITLCLKNLKGLLVGEEKRTFHEIGLNKAIVDLNRTIKPDLNIVDCTRCMERMGPRGGDIIDMDLILAGVQGAYVDYVGMQIMGYTLPEVGHLEQYRESEDVDFEKVKTIGNTIESVKYDFKKVNLQGMIGKKLNIRNNDACSSCMNALILSIMSAQELDFSDKIFYLGSKFTGIEDTYKKVAFGKCCIDSLEGVDYTIPGCPPYPFELKKRLGNGK